MSDLTHDPIDPTLIEGVRPDDDEDDAPVTQTLPLDAWHRAKGGRMVEFAGYHMPVQYDGIMAEHLWTRESAGLFDVSHMGQLTFTGDGVVAALEAMLPADIAGLTMNRARYSLLLDESGGILDDLMLTRRHQMKMAIASTWSSTARPNTTTSGTSSNRSPTTSR